MSRNVSFHLVTLFPEAVEPYFGSSVLGAAQKKKIISVRAHQLRMWGAGPRRKVDDRPYGGGAGMVLSVGPIIKAVSRIASRKSARRKIAVLSAKGRRWDQKIAYDWSKKYDEFIFVSGRYEGIDERAISILKADEISIGPYVLTDGDAAAMVIISSIARLVPGVIKLASLAEESHWNMLVQKEKTTHAQGGLEYPHYTRPEVFVYKGKKYRVPKALLSGDHKKVAEWRARHSH